MTNTTARLGMPMILPAQAQKHVTHNEALVLLDAITQLVITAQGVTEPPAEPAPGDTYVVGDLATDIWSGQDGKLAQWAGSQWQFIVPQEGWLAWDLEGGNLTVYSASTWQTVKGSGADVIDQLGINTSADAVNRLAVASDATLYSHVGAGHQVKVNKAASSDTASLLYQSNWSGRAELGLTGDNDFHVKVSPDGSNFLDALIVNAATGAVNGAAVQDSATDATEQRLMKVGAFGLGRIAGSPYEIGDIDDNAKPAGTWAFTASTSGTLPPGFDGFFGQVSVERYNSSIVRQFASRNNGDSGVWWRSHNGGSWEPWRRIYDSENLLAPVAHNNGHPTGGVIERGTNADGTYVRFADGTQICTDTINLGDPTSGGNGTFANPYFTPASSVTLRFAMPFVVAPVVTMSHSVAGGGAGILSRSFQGFYSNVTEVAVLGYRAMRLTDNSDTSAVSVHYQAFGRWL